MARQSQPTCWTERLSKQVLSPPFPGPENFLQVALPFFAFAPRLAGGNRSSTDDDGNGKAERLIIKSPSSCANDECTLARLASLLLMGNRFSLAPPPQPGRLVPSTDFHTSWHAC